MCCEIGQDAGVQPVVHRARTVGRTVVAEFLRQRLARLEARVDAIEVFRKSIDEANVGENVGVLFKGVDKSQLSRGSVLTSSSSAYGEAPPI